MELYLIHKSLTWKKRIVWNIQIETTKKPTLNIVICDLQTLINWQKIAYFLRSKLESSLTKN